MTYTSELLDQAENFVRDFYRTNRNNNVLFHTLDQTIARVELCREILRFHNMEKDLAFNVKCAAWLCTLGYLSEVSDPVGRSVSVAKGFLMEMGVELIEIEGVLELIRITSRPGEASTQMEKILCDALFYHYGTADFFKQEKLLRKQTELTSSSKLGKLEWWQGRFDKVSSYEYKTEYCITKLAEQKKINQQQISEKILDLSISQSTETFSDAKKERPERGVETMFKITSGNNQRLSDMADNKAHILITVNSIILSAIISLVLRKLEDNHFLILPSLILLCVCLATMILSILATRPSIPKGTFTAKELDEKNVNLLYFGNFYKMHSSDYTRGMFKVMNDSVFLYSMLIKDVFAQGVVLGRKYRLLRIAYNIFMYGLSLSIVTFMAASILDQFIQY